jgi:hypothetical protein
MLTRKRSSMNISILMDGVYSLDKLKAGLCTKVLLKQVKNPAVIFSSE